MSDEEKKEDAKPEAEAAPEEKKPEVKEEAVKEETATSEEAPAEEPVIEETIEPKELPNRDLRPGMVVRVHEKIKDVSPKGEIRERVQVFEGIILGIKGKAIGRTMTVKKDAKGWMVEKIFPLASPNIDKVEILKQYKPRRAKLTFLRGKYKKKMKEIKKDVA